MVSLGLSAVAGTQDGEQYPTEEVGGTWREDRGKAFQGTVGLGTATRSSGMDMSSPSPPELLNMTANMDIDSPLGFLTALERTHFQPRKAFLVRNGWQTRCFKVTDNSATPPEGASGCSRWFIDWCRKAGLSDEAQVDAAWNALQERQQRRGGKGGLTVAALAGNAPEDPTAVGEAPSTGTVSETHSLAPHDPQDVLNADLGPAKLLRVESESGSGAPSAPVSARPLRPAPIQTRSDACADPGSNGTAMPPAVAEAGAPATASSSVAPTPMAGAKVDIFSPKNRPKPGKTAMEEQYHLHRLPSVALARFAAAVVDGDEYSSRAYLEGRRRHQANSRFRLAPVAVPALCANTANATGTTASPAAIAVLLDREIVRNRHKDHALRSCLLPDQTAPNHVQAVLTGTASAKSAVGLVTKASAFSDRASGPLAADSNLKDADSGARTNVLDAMAQLHGSPAEAAITTDPDIIGWKEYSCHAALNDHLGPSKSLPVLSLAPKDPFSKPPKKSSLKFGNGSLAAVEGKIDQDINMYSSYLDVYKASYAKSAAQRNHLHNR